MCLTYLTGQISWDGVGDLTALNSLNLSRNQFYGTVDWDVFEAFDDLKILDLAYNNFDGSIDLSYLQPSISKITLSGNEFTGTIDWDIISDLHHNGTLKSLYLDNNKFSGYVDFSWMRDSKFGYIPNNTQTVSIWIPMEISIDTHLPCMFICAYQYVYYFYNFRKHIQVILRYICVVKK